MAYEDYAQSMAEQWASDPRPTDELIELAVSLYGGYGEEFIAAVRAALMEARGETAAPEPEMPMLVPPVPPVRPEPPPEASRAVQAKMAADVDLSQLRQPGTYLDVHEKVVLQLARVIHKLRDPEAVATSWEAQQEAQDYFNQYGFEATLTQLKRLEELLPPPRVYRYAVEDDDTELDDLPMEVVGGFQDDPSKYPHGEFQYFIESFELLDPSDRRAYDVYLIMDHPDGFIEQINDVKRELTSPSGWYTSDDVDQGMWQWFDAATSQDQGERDQAFDSLGDAISSLHVVSMHDRYETTELMKEILVAGLEAVSRVPSADEIKTVLTRKATSDDVLELRRMMRYTIDELDEWYAPEGWDDDLPDDYEDLGPDSSRIELAIESLRYTPELLGKNPSIEYHAALDDRPGFLTGVLTAKNVRKNDGLIFDVGQRLWTVGNPDGYIAQFPGRFQQISFWETSPEFGELQDVPVYAEVPPELRAPDRPALVVPEEVEPTYASRPLYSLIYQAIGGEPSDLVAAWFNSPPDGRELIERRIMTTHSAEDHADIMQALTRQYGSGPALELRKALFNRGLDIPEEPTAEAPEVAVQILDKFPDDTKLETGYVWSKWMGQLAMVDTDGGWRSEYMFSDPSYSAQHFDPVNLRQKFLVRFATEPRTGKMIPADASWLGRSIDTQGDGTYENSSFVIKGDWGRPALFGGFSAPVEFWVGLKLKDLSPGQFRALEKYLETNGFVDVSEYRKVSKKRWEAALITPYDDLESVDDENWNLDSAVADLLRSMRWNDTRGRSEEQLWASIPGVYATKKATQRYDQGFKFIISTAELLERQARKASKPKKKKETYKQANARLIQGLRSEGWSIGGGTKYPHATHPQNWVRIWFKPQTIDYYRPGPGARWGQEFYGIGVREAWPSGLDARETTVEELIALASS